MALHSGQALADAGAVLVASYREAESRVRERADVFAELGRTGRRIPLRGPTAADIEAYVATATGSRPTRQVVAKLREITEGNPFFVGAIVRLLAREGTLKSLDESTRDPFLRIPEEGLLLGVDARDVRDRDGDALVDGSADRADPNRATQSGTVALRLRDGHGPVSGARARASFTMLDMAMGETTIPLEEARPGTYRGAVPVLGMPGRWGVRLEIGAPRERPFTVSVVDHVAP
jgi:hypothetical protein